MRQLVLLLVIGCAGCGGGESRRVEHSVSGRVTFDGQPVAEGTVGFEDATAGLGASAALNADGTYSTTLPDGNYKVTIQPPLVTTPDSPNSPGGEEFKPVENIPPKYHAADTTPLTARVTADQRQHDFEMSK
jgi:hypothetical protein